MFPAFAKDVYKGVAVLALLLALFATTTGCELLLGDAAIGASEISAIDNIGEMGMGVEGVGFEDSIGKDVVGPEDGRIPTSTAAINEYVTRMAQEWGEGRAAGADYNGALANNAQELAQKSIGSEPAEGIVEHFDMNNKYMGKTVVTESGGANFNARGVETGYLKRFPARTNLWDIKKMYRGYSVPRTNTTVIYDAEGNITGYSVRTANIIKTFNQANGQVAYSYVHPMTQRTLAAIPSDLGGLFVRRTGTGFTRNGTPQVVLRATEGHFEYFNCCMLKVAFHVTNPEDSLPFRSEMWPSMHPYVGTPSNPLPGNQIQVYNGSNLAGDYAFSMNPGQSESVFIQLPIPASMLGGLERLTQTQLNAAGCRLMASVMTTKDWSGFTASNGAIVLPLPCSPSLSSSRTGRR
jgi:hypothetical protein